MGTKFRTFAVAFLTGILVTPLLSVTEVNGLPSESVVMTAEQRVFDAPVVKEVKAHLATMFTPAVPAWWSTDLVSYRLWWQVYSADELTKLCEAGVPDYADPRFSQSSFNVGYGGCVSPETSYKVRFRLEDLTFSRESFSAFTSFTTAALPILPGSRPMVTAVSETVVEVISPSPPDGWNASLELDVEVVDAGTSVVIGDAVLGSSYTPNQSVDVPIDMTMAAASIREVRTLAATARELLVRFVSRNVITGDRTVGQSTTVVVGRTPRAINLSSATSSANGFAVNVTNYSGSYTYSGSSTVGKVVLGSPSGSVLPIFVTGLSLGQTATLTLVVSRVGYPSGRTFISGSPVECPSCRALEVSKSGSGAGTVTSNVGGLSCGDVCSVSLASSTQVTLTASAASGSRFVGWSGACRGTRTCRVTMSAARSVTAQFTL